MKLIIRFADVKGYRKGKFLKRAFRSTHKAYTAVAKREWASTYLTTEEAHAFAAKCQLPSYVVEPLEPVSLKEALK